MLRHTPHEELGYTPKYQRRHCLCLADCFSPVSNSHPMQGAAHDPFTSAACPGPDIPFCCPCCRPPPPSSPAPRWQSLAPQS